jgi:hypothetical protein
MNVNSTECECEWEWAFSRYFRTECECECELKISKTTHSPHQFSQISQKKHLFLVYLCTCTIIWLVKYFNFYLKSDLSEYDANLAKNYQIGDDSNVETVRHCFSNRKLFTEKMTQCNLEENFKKVCENLYN